ncbi:MAG: hypothetical protein KDA42_10625 [Planctomycetales bacterium]|nr:hypothetical protein [Planctomycetales bacterium]
MRFSLRLLLSFTTAICLTLATAIGPDGFESRHLAWFPCYWIGFHFGVEMLGYVLADLIGGKSIRRRYWADDSDSLPEDE